MINSAARPRALGYGIALLPSLISIALFYSLAIHMFSALGAWPTMFETIKFPAGLQFHKDLAQSWIIAWGLISFYVTPLATILCFAIRRFQWSRYFAVMAGSFWICVLFMVGMGPKAYVEWWLD